MPADETPVTAASIEAPITTPVQVTRDEHGRRVWQHRFPTAEELAAARAEHAAPLMADPFAGLVLADDELAF